MSDLIDSRCQRDWQGPSDAECVDDLLVIHCDVDPKWHANGVVDHHGVHPDTGRGVIWTSGTDNLCDADTGRVVQYQFRPAAPNGQGEGTA